jgi:probable rRNA maturation factor
MPAIATRSAQHAIAIDIVVESALWSAQPGTEYAVRRAIEAAAAFQGKAGEIAVLLADDAAIRTMNAQWRGIDKPTNVLSFPAGDPALGADTAHLGDIAIACETVAREAEAENKAFLDHLAHLSIHGYLHLIGFDHETDREAERMEHLETRILASLGIADPYADRPGLD